MSTNYGKRWTSSRDEQANSQELDLAQQERFEIRPAENVNDDGIDGWATAKSARIARPISGGRLGITEKPIDGSRDPVDPTSTSYMVNKISAGLDPQTTDQREMVVHQDGMPLQLGSDYAGLSAKELASGFALRRMASTDDNQQDFGDYETIRGEDDGGNQVKGFHKRRPILNRE